MRKPNYYAIWSYLLLKASHDDQYYISKNEKHLVRQGQLHTSKRSISEFFGISTGSVQNILDYFEREHMIEQKATSKYTVISIQNYRDYQGSEHQVENKKVFNKKQIEHIQEYKNTRHINNTHTSKTGCVPCTTEEINHIASLLSVKVSDVENTHAYILNLIKAGEFKHKTVYYTLENWLRIELKKGQIKKVSSQVTGYKPFVMPTHESITDNSTN